MTTITMNHEARLFSLASGQSFLKWQHVTHQSRPVSLIGLPQLIEAITDFDPDMVQSAPM